MTRLHRALALTALSIGIAALGGCGTDDDDPPPPSLEITEGPADSSAPLESAAEVSLSVSASSSEGSDLTYAWSSDCSSLPTSGSFSDASAQAPVWTAPENLSGETESCTVSVRVSDGEDLEETSSSIQAVASAPVIPEPADAVAFMYNEEVVRTIELELPPEDLAFLDGNPAAEIYVEGSIIIGEERYDGVGIRYKGSIGTFFGCTDSEGLLDPSGPKTCHKLSMKVKFNEFASGQRFYGVKRLQFHAMNWDRSMLVERMGYELFREMGVAAPRTAYIRLLINGAYIGIHLLVEQNDGQFVRSRFSEGGKGNLYKEAWPITDSPDYYLDSLRTNRDEDPSAEKMVAFFEDLEADPDAAVSKWLDIDYTMRYFAVDRAINNDDGVQKFYCPDEVEFCGNHNYFWYEEVESDRHWLIPWDLDNAAFGGPNILDIPGDWRDENPSCVPEYHPNPIWAAFLEEAGMPPALNPACDPMIHALAEYSHIYREKQQELLNGPFSQAVVEQRVDAWADLLRDEVADAYQTDPAVHPAPADWEDSVTTSKDSLTIARQALAEDIDEHQP